MFDSTPNILLIILLDGIITLEFGYFSFNNRGSADITPQSPIPCAPLHITNSSFSKYSSGILNSSVLSKPKLSTSPTTCNLLSKILLNKIYLDFQSLYP
jgi:hypothetical protein